MRLECWRTLESANFQAVLESYITHIRIIEDAAYPSTPPPPNANPAAKKPRLIIVAVRRSGRVRMHKARENVNGTFSIGKTWMLDDLTSIQSYNGMNPVTPEEEQHKLWAGGIGFIVTLGKPYYWQANTQKEKQFFVASLVKIYTKYTGGRTPDLVGFDAREKDQLLGVVSRSLPPSQVQSPSGPGPGPVPGYGQTQNRAPPRREASRERMQRQMSPGGQQSFPSQPSSRPLLNARREDSPSSRTSLESDRAGPGSGPQHGQANLRRLAGSNQSQDSFARSDDASSLPPRSRGGMSGMPSGPGRFQDRSVTPTSQRATTPDSTVSGGMDISRDAPPIPAPLALPPERRRPPMPIVGDSRQRSQNLSTDDIVPAPLASPGMRREELRPPVRSIERNQARDRDLDIVGTRITQKSPSITEPIPASMPTPLTVSNKISNVERPKIPAIIPVLGKSQSEIVSPLSAKPQEEEPTEERPGLGPMIKKQRSTANTPVSPISPDTAGEEDNSRPGLGPMIRKQKSKADVANSFLKAAKSANSFNTFKPRAGGAAERLRQAAATAAERSPDGPDGITGVVPAPSLAKSMSTENHSNSSTPNATPVEKSNNRNLNSVPEVKITVPDSARPTSVEDSRKALDDNASPEKPKTKEVKRPKAPSEIMQKELASINVDPAILGGRGGDLIAAWEEFGWAGEGVHTKNIDQMKEEIERELNRAQAGGWLTRLDEEDERIAAVHAGLDRCVAECDELDGLLTLNLVELSVSL